MATALTAQANPPLTAAERAARSVFVGNIPYEATEEQLKDIFAQVGPVVSFRLVYDRETGKPKGYGFCEYQDVETAQSAMRNLNNHDFNGRPLRVGVAAGEQNKDDMKSMQQAVGGAPIESPYGDTMEPEKAPEAISRAVASLPPEQMFELMKQMKLCIQNNPNEARNMLLQNPQLAYALLQAQIVMKIVDPQVAMAMLHRQTEVIPPLLPSQTANGGVPVKGGAIKDPLAGLPPTSMAPTPSSMPMQLAQSLPPLSAPSQMAPPSTMAGPDYGRGGPNMLPPDPRAGPGGLPPMDMAGRGGPMGGAPPRAYDPRGAGMNDMPPHGMAPRDHDMRIPPRDMNLSSRDMGGPRDLASLRGDLPGPRDVGPRDMGGPRDMAGHRDIGGPRDIGGHRDMGGHRDIGGPMGPRDMGRLGMPSHRPGMGPADMQARGGPPRDIRDPRGNIDPHGMPPRSMGGPDPRSMGTDRSDPRAMGGDPRGMAGDMRGMGAGDPRGMDPRGSIRGPPPGDLPRVSASGPPRQASGGLGGLGALGALSGGPAGGGQDKEKAALIMQVLQLSDQQIAMLPPDQRQSILILKEQISRSTGPP